MGANPSREGQGEGGGGADGAFNLETTLAVVIQSTAFDAPRVRG